MSRKSKLFFSLVSLCFSIAVLCFGVYSALSVSYTVSGSVSYEIQDVFVSVTRKVYRALSETPVQSSHSGNVTELKTAQTIDTSKYDDIGAGDSFSTYDNGKVTSSGQDYTYPEDGDESKNIDLTYGSPTGNETQGYAFYIVIDIHNLGSEIINAQITAPTSLENTILRDSGNVEITANGTERIVLGLALDDVTTGITSADFTYKITISCGELPIEPITDMEFSLNEAGTATLESYTGSGGDVVIPESIGYDTTSSKTLTFNTMEDMVSGMNMLYFFQDLYITLPNQEEQLIENAYLWMLKNMDKETGSLPQNYFPMTIQTVESYTINQDDYKQYADFGQDMTAMLAFAPIQMIMQNMLLTSVDVQYGEEKQSFTFNMENYNAAVNEGDDSETSKAIDYFMSKAYDAAESLLPVTYSNFEYNVAVKGDEYTVTTIASRAFSSQYKIAIRNLYIPNSITNIESYSFDHYNVSEVLIENIYAEDLDTLLNIDYDFITVSESHTGDSIISHVNPFYIADNVYINGEPLPEEITVGEGLTEIKPGTLAGLKGVTSIIIADGVTTIGDSAFFGCSDLTRIYIPNSVLNIDVSAFTSCVNLNTVTFEENSQLQSIGAYAFGESGTWGGEISCFRLTSIEIPSSVTNIGIGAFNGCYALAEVYNYSEQIPQVTLGNSDQYTNGYLGQYAKVVYNPSDLTGGKPVTRIQPIGDVQYYKDGEDFIALAPSVIRDSLTTLTLDGRTTEINTHAFNNCDALETVTFGDSSQLKSIGSGAFRDCSNLTSIEIPSSVTSIGGWAFSGCEALEEVNITDIDAWAMIDFDGYASNPLYDGAGLYLNGELVTEVTLTTATKIGSNAFYSYDLLTSITIPSSVTSIGSSAFWNCYALAEIYNYSEQIPQVTLGNSDQYTNGYLGQYAKVVYNPSDLTGGKPVTRIRTIGDVQYYKDGEDFIALAPSVIRDSLTTLTLDSRTTEINRYAFYDCDALATVTFGANSQLESIGSDAFRYCSNLTSIEIPSSVKSIGDSAFWNCSNLTSIEIPSSVTSIGSYAFYNCSALETVTFKDTTTEWTVRNGDTTNTITIQSQSTMATYLTETYYSYTWTKKQSA